MAYADSIAVYTQAPELIGVWVHDPTEADTSVAHYLYGNVGRTESVSVQAAPISFVGRTYPVYNIGGNESQTVEIAIAVPSGAGEQEMVEDLRDAVRNRRTLCYRDGRGRLVYGVITGIKIADLREGTGVSGTIITVDYEEEIS